MKSTPIKTKILNQDDNSKVVVELHDCYISIMQDADLIVVRNANLPKLIKALQSFVVMLLLSVSAFAQYHTSILTEIGTTDFKSQSYAAMFGFTNFQDDSFHAGPLYKDYGSAYRAGIRVDINLNLNRALFVFIQGDIFANTGKQENSSFLENSTGLGFRIFKGLSASLGYQMEDYNPITEIRKEDQLLIKLGYKFKL